MPEEETLALEFIYARIDVLKTTKGLGDEFATRAIQAGLSPVLVVLGDRVKSMTGMTPTEMVAIATSYPDSIEATWNWYLKAGETIH